MTMARAVTEIDRLIEQGLSLYGEGDLDGALLLWERALGLDPENAQANSYVDYVKINYDLLTSDSNADQVGPFGIADGESDYQIEILPGEDVEPVTAAPPLYMDVHDGGWAIGEERRGAEPDAAPPLMLEIEADEPPAPEPSFETALTGESVSFEDNTREYPGGAGRPAVALLAGGHVAEPGDFVPEVTPAFGSAADLQTPPGGFGMEITEMRRRDLGFVQPAAGRITAGPPELKMTLRTPSSVTAPPPAGPAPQAAAVMPSDVHRAQAADGEPRPTITHARPAVLSLDLELPEPAPVPSDPAAASQAPDSYISLDLELTPPPGVKALDLVGRAVTRPASTPSAPSGPTEPLSSPDPDMPVVLESAANTVDLVMSLPTPRPLVSSTRQLPAKPRLPTPESRPPSERPVSVPPPDAEDMPPVLGLGSAPTQEMPLALQLDPILDPVFDPAVAAPAEPPPPSGSREHAETSTGSRGFRPDQLLITAPTRDLGLRLERPSSEDETTREVDVHKIRKARGTGKPAAPAMDPIDARGAEILEEIDHQAPANESREDRTRRRITALLERATEWGRGTDLARAVTAVDLALSEDPNSALAQKLIHRNREAIMNAFQGFLGDLQRTPTLARPLHELSSAPISPRAAFLLSRVDGTLSLDEILDVSGMPRLEAYRYLCQLFLRGILR